MIIYDDIYPWEGFGGKLRLASGKCRLRIFDLKKGNGKGLDYIRPIIAVVSDISESKITIKSCSGHIATKVTREFNIDPSRMLYVEYYPAVIYGEKDEKRIPERYDAIEFTWHGDKAINPKWRTLKPPLVDLIKRLMED
jgi:hypothetical protein